MRILVNKSAVRGRVRAPSSKSYTIRSLMCAALAEGQSVISRPLRSDDTDASLRVLGQVGIRTDTAKDPWLVNGSTFKAPAEELYCGDSAATLRFMSAICNLVPGRCRLTAGKSLSQRPVDTLVDALRRWGADISSKGAFAPVIVNGGELRGGLTELPGDISSQYVSALLLVAPLTGKSSTIWLTTPPESRPYIAMTLECQARFGVHIKHSSELMEFESFPRKYTPAKYTVEGDWSSASYLLGLGAVGGEIEVEGLNVASRQGDKAIEDLLQEMGARVDYRTDALRVTAGSMKAVKADLTDCIDLLPTVAVLAALSDGNSVLIGIKRARLKESDRVSAVREGLERAGIQVTEREDSLNISGGKPRAAVIDAHNDHRIAMAFSLMGVAAGGIAIEGAECVSKTYPEYWKVLRSLGVKLDEQ